MVVVVKHAGFQILADEVRILGGMPNEINVEIRLTKLNCRV